MFLDRLLAALPSIVVERSTTSKPAPGFDLAIYDGVAVPADPGAPFLAIAPPGGAPGVRVTGEVERPAVTLVHTDDALLSGIDLSEVGVARAQRLEAPGDEVLVGAEGTPLLIRGSRGGRPFAYLGFALAQSNLPVQVAFPLLADRLVTELAGAALPPGEVRVGQPLPVNTAAALTIDAPGDVHLTLPAGAAAPLADRAGFWTVHQEGRPDVSLAVNVDPAESVLAPADSLPVPERALGPGERRPAGELPQLKWVVALLAAILAAEGWLSWRRRGVSRRQWRVAVGTRVAIAGLLGAALLGLALPRTASRVAVMFLIDGSDSMGSGGRAAAVDWVRDALAEQPEDALAGVAFFGGDARLELTVQHDATLLQPATRVDASRTDLAGALRLAGAVLPTDARRRIVVVSDGRVNQGDAATEARRLREDGIQVDVHPVDVAGGPDAAVARVDTPGLVRQGEAFTVRATIDSTRAQTLRVTWQRNGETIQDRTVDVVAGQTVVELPQTAPATGGLASYKLTIDGPANSVKENDTAFAAVQIEGPARVLVVEGMPGQGAALTAALRAGGLPVDVVSPAELPAIDRLATYSSTVLVDVDARSLAAEQVQTLAAATRDLGRGLVAVGGDRSYALGGYLGSELEKLLPVTSDVKDPKRRASVAEVLAIDSSGSMGACHCSEGGMANGLGGGNRGGGGVNKTDIARAAAARTIAALNADDQVGVLAFNTQHRWVVPLQTLPPEDVVTKGLRELSPVGGTNLTLPLKEAGDALKAAKARLKHIILFTDGFTSVGGLDTLVAQAAALANEGITVSVVATGETGASENLSAGRRGRSRPVLQRAGPQRRAADHDAGGAAGLPADRQRGDAVPDRGVAGPARAGAGGHAAAARLARRHDEAHGPDGAGDRRRRRPAAGVVAGRPGPGHVVDERRVRPLVAAVGGVGGLHPVLDRRRQGHVPRRRGLGRRGAGRAGRRPAAGDRRVGHRVAGRRHGGRPGGHAGRWEPGGDARTGQRDGVRRRGPRHRRRFLRGGRAGERRRRPAAHGQHRGRPVVLRRVRRPPRRPRGPRPGVVALGGTGRHRAGRRLRRGRAPGRTGSHPPGQMDAAGRRPAVAAGRRPQPRRPPRFGRRRRAQRQPPGGRRRQGPRARPPRPRARPAAAPPAQEAEGAPAGRRAAAHPRAPPTQEARRGVAGARQGVRGSAGTVHRACVVPQAGDRTRWDTDVDQLRCGRPQAVVAEQAPEGVDRDPTVGDDGDGSGRVGGAKVVEGGEEAVGGLQGRVAVPGLVRPVGRHPGPVGEELVERLHVRAVPVHALPQAGVDDEVEAAALDERGGRLDCPAQGAAPDGTEAGLSGDPFGGPDGLLPTEVRQPGIARDPFLLAVLDDQRLQDHCPTVGWRPALSGR